MSGEDVYAVAMGAMDWWSLRQILQQAGLRACDSEDMENSGGDCGAA